ncbi:MAG: prepilin-type N-terminal cleavage/methylation domain-containing protein [Halothiobacillaceae bacterium]
MTGRYHKPRQTGVTLIELMIGMVLGLFIVGGVIGIFVANQQSAAEKRGLDNTQEAFRYSAYTISRVVRNSSGFLDPIDDDKLVVSINRNPEMPDCLGYSTEKGDPGDPDPRNEFYFTSENGVGVLRCASYDEDGNLDGDEILVEGFDLTQTGFTFALPDAASNWISDSDYVTHGALASDEWDDVIAVRVHMRTEPGLSSVFTATSRQVVLAQAS